MPSHIFQGKPYKNPTNLMCPCSGKIRLGQIEEYALSGKTHICTISVQIIAPNRIVTRRRYDSYKVTWMVRYRKNQYMCQEEYNTLCWYFHSECTDNFYPPNEVTGN